MEDDKRQECSQPTAPEYRWQDFATICIRCKEYVRRGGNNGQELLSFLEYWENCARSALGDHRGRTGRGDEKIPVGWKYSFITLPKSFLLDF